GPRAWVPRGIPRLLGTNCHRVRAEGTHCLMAAAARWCFLAVRGGVAYSSRLPFVPPYSRQTACFLSADRMGPEKGQASDPCREPLSSSAGQNVLTPGRGKDILSAELRSVAPVTGALPTINPPPGW